MSSASDGKSDQPGDGERGTLELRSPVLVIVGGPSRSNLASYLPIEVSECLIGNNQERDVYQAIFPEIYQYSESQTQ